MARALGQRTLLPRVLVWLGLLHFGRGEIEQGKACVDEAWELSGAGSGSGVSYIAADGRYLGGEWQDSTTLTVRLPVQGLAVPVVQVTRISVTVLP
jgi:hypothetical protein